MMKLYEYQKELLNSEEKEIVINWCRGSGKDTAIAVYILENKPKKVVYLGHSFGSIESELINLTFEYNFSLQRLNRGDFKLTFNSSGKEIMIEVSHKEDNLSGKRVNLLIDDFKYIDADLKDVRYDKYIKIITNNVNNISTNSSLKYITVDYKRALKSEAISFELVLDYLLNNRIEAFYREMAISDKPKKGAMSFTDFAQQALQKLQKQFLDIPNTKDTVLTRKNIIEMIKDLVELQIKLK